jgi:hypothetical protein
MATRLSGRLGRVMGLPLWYEPTGLNPSYGPDWSVLYSICLGRPDRETTAPPQDNAPRAIARWESTLAARLERFKHYPDKARARGDRGTGQTRRRATILNKGQRGGPANPSQSAGDQYD